MKQTQWYPGNMAKARSILSQDLKIVDLAVELLDARIPLSSKNPVLASMLKDKKHLILLHKADRADEEVTGRWLSHFMDRELKAMAFSVHHNSYLKQMMRYLKDQEHNLRPTRIKRPLRMIIIGIPNVGKSTLINYFVRKAVTKTANQPGITRGRQWVRIMPGLELLDTPGILWPNINDNTAKPLACVGAIPPGLFDVEEIACWLIESYLTKNKANSLLNRYSGLQPANPEVMLEKIGLSLGCLQQGGKVDLARASQLVLRDFQAGFLGKMTLEDPPDDT